MLTSLVAVLFGCRHGRTTFPLTRTVGGRPLPGEMYVTCLECGKEFRYDWDAMRITEAFLPLEVDGDEQELDPFAKVAAP